jgi:putative Ca2+/H+ antiporter (TMEM165/GDT1 family)
VQAVVSAFLLVAVAEMGDKTQLLAFSLASRFRRPWPVLAGILTATIVNHALAAEVGSWVSAHVPARTMAAILAVTFAAFGVWALRADAPDESDRAPAAGPYLTTVVVFFLAEMGDKTQLATIALGARFHSVVLVTAGTTLGMLAADGLAIFAGHALSERIPPRPLRWAAAALFFAFAAVSAWRAVARG